MVKKFLSQIILANLLVCNIALAIVGDFEERYYLRQPAFVESNRKEILFSTDKLVWSTKEKAIGSIRYVLSKEVPHIVARYDTLGQLTPEGIEGLRNDIYGITSGHFQVWGLGSALNAGAVPYFNRSYIDALLKIFDGPKLGLRRDGFLMAHGLLNTMPRPTEVMSNI